MKVLREILRLRKQDKDERDEQKVPCSTCISEPWRAPGHHKQGRRSANPATNFCLHHGIGVAVSTQTNNGAVALSAVGAARQFPPGPPPGAKLDVHNPDRAINPASGHSFSLRDGNWVDAKSGAIVKSPKLCASDVPPVKSAPAAAPVSRSPDDHAPPAPQPVGPAAKPDHLPPPPSVITH